MRTARKQWSNLREKLYGGGCSNGDGDTRETEGVVAATTSVLQLLPTGVLEMEVMPAASFSTAASQTTVRESPPSPSLLGRLRQRTRRAFPRDFMGGARCMAGR